MIPVQMHNEQGNPIMFFNKPMKKAGANTRNISIKPAQGTEQNWGYK